VLRVWILNIDYTEYKKAEMLRTSVITGFRIYHKTAKMINAVP